ncbi:MAG: 4-alpha-glucanotransferase [Chloroflexota bacterium]
MELTRASGILLHPTSLPSPYGIGDLGQAAYQFIDFLHTSKQTLWQILPLGPTGYGDSPYASFSSFAGNPLLISPDLLIKSGDLAPSDLADVPPFPRDKVDYSWVIHWKKPLLEKAASMFLGNANQDRKDAFDAFCEKQKDWLDDFALFMAVKETFDERAKAADLFGKMWSNYWPKDIALRDPEALTHWQREKQEAIHIQKVLQFYFFEQWQALRQYANAKHIRIIGDIPIFVAPDSADVWSNRHLFLLDEAGQSIAVAGVPPDYFSPTGQLWGNPLYNWQQMAADKYDWWIKRIQSTLNQVDILRIDHFRGFDAYWRIPADEETAIKGHWVKGPGTSFFETVSNALGELPIIAEDLGLITPSVLTLRDQFELPGMKVLQFAFSLTDTGELDGTHPFLPHNYPEQCVVYTGTHDNDTTQGWYEAQPIPIKDIIRRYLARDDHDIAWEFIRLAFASPARLAIIPLQDVLNLGSEARMNTPSTLGTNWAWRYQPEALSEWASSRLCEMTMLYGREPHRWQEKEADPDVEIIDDADY